jgi:flagellin-like protein
MKGISTVIATLLMLIITIALAGLAYSYISGIFTARTAVVLTITDAVCPGDAITVTVRNDGTAASGTITVSATAPNGAAAGSCTLTLNPGTSGSCNIDRPAGAPAGTYSLTASAPAANPVRGNAYCTTVGV